MTRGGTINDKTLKILFEIFPAAMASELNEAGAEILQRYSKHFMALINRAC